MTHSVALGSDGAGLDRWLDEAGAFGGLETHDRADGRRAFVLLLSRPSGER